MVVMAVTSMRVWTSAVDGGRSNLETDSVGCGSHAMGPLKKVASVPKQYGLLGAMTDLCIETFASPDSEVARRDSEFAPQKKKATRPEAFVINRKFMVSEHDAQQIEEMTVVISKAFGSKVSYSAISRALWAVVANSEEAIVAGGRGHNRQRLAVPSKGDHLAMVEYEEALSAFQASALKRL